MMRINKKLMIVCCLLMAAIMLSACASRRENAPGAATPAPAATPEPTATPAPTPAGELVIVTPTPEPAATPTPEPTPEPTPTPTPTPIPSATPAPTPTPSNLPRVTKSPTSETVAVNGSCQFIAKYENAKWAEWHFVSPDGSKDLDYKQAANEFKTLKILKGETKDLTLQNIPETMNGWKVYCRFSNDAGAVNTERATITVTKDTAGASPKVTKSPTGETVNPGGAATFVARHEGAIWAVWHFVSPDGTRDLTYTDAQAQFPTLTIVGGDQGTLKLSNIPSELNGWKVYCAFRNNVGTTNTDSALITVRDGQNQGGTATPTPAPQRAGFEGRWAEEIAGRCRVEFTYKGEGSMNVSVIWSSSAWERSCWSMTADVYKNDIMVYEDGHYWFETYSDDNSYTVSDESFGGTGSFYLENGKLHWYNDQTHQEVVLVPA